MRCRKRSAAEPRNTSSTLRLLPRQKSRLGRPGAVRCILSPAGPSRRLPDLRHSTRGRGAIGRGLQPRARRYVAPVSARRSQCPRSCSPFFLRGWRSLRRRHLNVPSLIALGVGTAYLCGLVATLARASSGQVPEPGRDDRSRSRHHRVGAAGVWLTIAHLDHTPENCAPAIFCGLDASVATTPMTCRAMLWRRPISRKTEHFFTSCHRR